MYLFAAVILSAHAELNILQYLAGNPNELRLLRAALGFHFCDFVRPSVRQSSAGGNNVG